MAKLAPVNPQMLSWAMYEADLSVTVLAERANLSPDRVSSFIAGDEQPQTGEVRRLARALKRSLVFFFMPSPPRGGPVVASFRRPVGNGGVRSLNPDELAAIRSVARWQQIVAWIHQKNQSPAPIVPIPEVQHGSSVPAAVKAIASWLDWDTDEQREANSPGAVLKLARNKLEANGSLLLQFSLGADSCRGFSVPHSDVPSIALNTSYNSAARVFTIFHELAHLTRGDQAVCGNPRDDDLERWCDEVAATVLIPANDMLEYLDKWVTTHLIATVHQCQRVARRYNVSVRAAAVRITQLGRAAFGLYDLVDREIETGSGSGGRSPEPRTTPVRRIHKLGNEIPRQLLRARDAGLLTEVQVRRYLDVNGEQLLDLSHRACAKHGVGED